jgi:hypothetical protein
VISSGYEAKNARSPVIRCIATPNLRFGCLAGVKRGAGYGKTGKERENGQALEKKAPLAAGPVLLRERYRYNIRFRKSLLRLVPSRCLYNFAHDHTA